MATTIRVQHYPSYTPMLELQVAADTTAEELQDAIRAKLASDEDQPIRVFASKWLFEIDVGGDKRKVVLGAKDLKSSIQSLGLSDYSVVYLEGPMMDSISGVGQALGVMDIQWRDEQRRQGELLHERRRRSDILRESQRKQNEMVLAAVASLKEEVRQLASTSSSTKSSLQWQCESIQRKIESVSLQLKSREYPVNVLERVNSNPQMIVLTIMQQVHYSCAEDVMGYCDYDEYENTNRSKYVDDYSFIVGVYGNTGIGNLKEAIYMATGRKPSRQRLVFEGVVLYDGDTLHAYGIYGGACINLR